MGLWADDKAMRVGPSSCVEVSLIQKTLNKSLVSFTMRVDRGKTATYEPPTLVPFRNLSFAASRTCLKSIFLLEGLNPLRTEFLVINIVNQSHRGSTKCPNGSWNWLNMIRAYHTASPEALKLCLHDNVHMRDRWAQADAPTLSQVEWRWVDENVQMPEHNLKQHFVCVGCWKPPTAAKRQELPGQVPLGFQTCAIPKAWPAGAPRLLENTGQCAVGVEKWAAAWQAGLVVWLAF